MKNIFAATLACALMAFSTHAQDKPAFDGSFTLAANDAVAPGSGGGSTLSVDGEKVAEGRIEKTVPNRFSLDETLDVGEDTGTPVTQDYKVPNHFTGKLESVTIELQ